MDLSALIARVSAGLDGVRACVVLSSDGLTLASHPEAGEGRAREAWGRLQQACDAQRGFLDTGEEVWAMVRRGPYTGVVITSAGAKPGLLLDKLDSLLRTAEEGRTRDATEVAAPRADVTRRPRTSLHGDQKRTGKPEGQPAQSRQPSEKLPARGPAAATPEGRPAPDGPRYSAPEVLQGAAKRVVDITAEAPPARGGGGGGAPPSGDEPEPAGTVEATPSPPSEPAGPVPQRITDDSEVDRVALAREFGRLSESGEER